MPEPVTRGTGGQFVRPVPADMPGEAGPAPGHAGAKVTVACKLPHGLLLRVFEWETRSVSVIGGGSRDEKISKPRPETVRIRGYAVPFGVAPSFPIEGGFALTAGVDKDFFDLWLEQNRTHHAVRNGLIFAFEKQADAVNEARNRASLKSGMEGLDPQNLPRGIRPGNTSDATEP